MTLSEGGKEKRKRAVPVKRRALSKEIREEEDPQWRQWFMEVERRKKRLSDPKSKPFVRVNYDKDGKEARIERKKSVPLPVKSFLTKNHAKAGRSLNSDLLLIQATWKQSVGSDIGEASQVYAFKNGVLTVTIFSSGLLQEIRQFHQEAILADLRDIWQASQPLVKITYRLGKQ